MQGLPVPSTDVLCLFVRSARSTAEVAELLRAAVKRIDPDLLVFDLSSMDDRIRESIDDRRAIMLLLAGFAGIALLLSAIGIYGTLAYDISQRTREIGIRGAIGCTAKQITGLILRQGLAKAGMGLLLGMIGAPWLCRFLSSQLFEVKASDPIAYIAVAVLLLIVAIAASYLPARRAACIDPVIALRNE
jgi:ABC-type antimicrobial peptide transport system permease subunit